MKIFISHKNEDSQIALNVHTRFKAFGVDTYLDILDSNIADDGKQIEMPTATYLTSTVVLPEY